MAEAEGRRIAALDKAGQLKNLGRFGDLPLEKQYELQVGRKIDARRVS